MPRPNLFIVGSWKAGTTSLYHYLDAHPEVFMSALKEPHYFVHNSRFRPRMFWKESSYLRLFNKAGSAKAIGEASAYYFCMPESAKMIHDFNPDAKIIIMLRHPVDTIYAFHSESIFLGRENRDFATALAYQETHTDRMPHYLDLICCWPDRIQTYWDLFGKDQVHIIFFEDLANAPASMYQKLLAFLGLSPDFEPDFSIHNPSKAPPSRLFSRISANPLVIMAMQAASLSMPLAEKINDFRKTKLQRQARPPLDPQLAAQLATAFSPTIDRLSQMLGKDLSHWKKKYPLPAVQPPQ